MTRHRGLSSASGVSGAVVLFVLLAGFVAMHGVASTTEAGVHHSGVTLIAGSGHEEIAPGRGAATRSSMPGASTSGEGSDESHGSMAGCLIILGGIVLAVALGMSHWTWADVRSRARSWAGLVTSPRARPPPRRYRISLCVLRV